MKKLIAILAVIALMTTALSAQEGSWSVWGNGNIGTSLNFLPIELTKGGHATTHLNGYDYRGEGDMRGNFGFTYSKGGLSAGLGINQQDGVSGQLSYYGDNFAFNAEQNLKYFINGTGGHRDALWGNYNFNVLNGILLEASVSRTGNEQWKTTGIFDDTFTHTQWSGDQVAGNGVGFGWTLNTANYLLLDASLMDGFNVGFVLPNLFIHPAGDFLTNSLQHTVFGVKFATGPIGVGLQFALQGIGVKDNLLNGLYLGVSIGINDQMSAGLEFRGRFGTFELNKDNEEKANMDIKIGGSFSFNGGNFGAGLAIKYEDEKTVKEHDQVFRVEPNVWFNLVEGYLQGKLSFGLNFGEQWKGPGVNDYEGKVSYWFQPELFYNFLGTGAGGFDTGMAVRYKVEGPEFGKNNTSNYLEIMFGWSF